MDNCLRTSLDLKLTSSQAVAVGSMRKIPVSEEERMAWAIVDHDLEAVRT